MTPQEEFQLMLDRSGLTAWHNAGYKGQGIIILNCESVYKHGAGTGNILRLTAPEAEIHAGDLYTDFNGDKLIQATINGMDFAKYVRLNKINIVNASQRGTHCKEWAEYCERLQVETGVVFFNAAGNDSEGDGETLNHRFPASCSILVGAVNINQKRMIYSSVGEELDFMAFAGLIGGTSAATPFLAGMTACIFSKYGKMSPKETYDYLKSISKDLGELGDDIYYGEGMPILRDTKTTIKLTVGSKTMLVDGREIEIDQPPIINADSWRTLVPVRAISEAFGATVEWNQETQTITIER